MSDKTKYTAKPFVKWAGGKTQLLSEIERLLPKNLSSKKGLVYVEPFVGGGAVLFWILQNFPNIEKAVINDINSELICTYRTIKEDVEELIECLLEIENEYIPLDQRGRKDLFIEKRQVFNSRQISGLQTAAIFIFLNRTCFNGLYRVNSKGEFNVPHGKYVNPKICDKDNLRAVSALLQKAEILNGDFSDTIKYAGQNSLYYLDPPYKPLSESSSFTSYASNGFDDKEQLRLRDFCEIISKKEASFIASNSDLRNTNPNDDFFDEIYKDFQIQRVLASRMINSKSSGRGKLKEIIISNYK